MQATRLLLAMMSILGVVNVEAEQALRVLTWNIHRAEGIDKRYDLDRIARVIRSADPDLVALQEVDCGTRRSKGDDQAQELERRLTGYRAHFVSAMPYNGGLYGCCLLSRLPVGVTNRIPLSGRDGHEPRVAGVMEVQQSGQSIVFAGTHLDHRSEDLRKEQLAQVLSGLNAHTGSLVVLAADFNAHCRAPSLSALEGGWKVLWNGEPERTYPADQPQIAIDHVFVRPASRIKSFETTVLGEGVASDHRPVLSVLRWNP